MQLLIPQFWRASGVQGKGEGEEVRRGIGDAGNALATAEELLPPALMGVSLEVWRLDQLASLRADLRDLPDVSLALEWFADDGVGAGQEMRGEAPSGDEGAREGLSGSEADVVWIVNVSVASTRQLVAGRSRLDQIRL